MNQQRPLLNIPSAIVIAATIVAVALIYVKKPVSTTELRVPGEEIKKVNLAPVTAADHIYGNPDAPIKIVEFSDPSCPFCKTFHPTMEQLMKQYGPGGKVAWVYRHYPLDKPNQNGQILHPNANREAQAFECAAELGGNTKFWEYASKFYELTPAVTPQSPEGLDPKQLPVIARSIGLDDKKFLECVDSNKYSDKIEKQFMDGVNAGVAGTPTSFVLTPSGSKIPIEGAQPYSVLRSTIEALLAQQ